MMEESKTSPVEPLSERRRLPRLKLTAPIQFRNVLKPQEPFAGALCTDLSADGVRMKATSFLPRDARLVMLISLPKLLKPVRMIVRVVWMQQQRFSGGCDCGFQFVEIIPKDRETIATYVERGVVARFPAASSS